MATLNDDQKTFIVQQLALFRTPLETVEAVKAEFDVKVSRQAVRFYQPKVGGKDRLSERWITLFNATREAAVRETADIGVANKTIRLRELDGMYHRALSSKNLPLAAQLLEQAAKEMGGQYTNKHQLEHSGGNPFQVNVIIEREPEPRQDESVRIVEPVRKLRSA